jgi:hypothetical protein
MNAEPRHIMTHGDTTVTVYANGRMSIRSVTLANTKELRNMGRNLSHIATQIDKAKLPEITGQKSDETMGEGRKPGFHLASRADLNGGAFN